MGFPSPDFVPGNTGGTNGSFRLRSPSPWFVPGDGGGANVDAKALLALEVLVLTLEDLAAASLARKKGCMRIPSTNAIVYLGRDTCG